MSDEDERARIARLNRLEAENRVLRADLDRFRINVVVFSTVLAAIVALTLPLFDLAEPDPFDVDDEVQVSGPASVSVFGLAGEANDIDNGTIETFAIILIVSLIALGAAAIATLGGRGRVIVLALSGVVALAWFLLIAFVSAAGGDGTIGDLGYQNSFLVAVVPLVAALGVATAFVAGDVRR